MNIPRTLAVLASQACDALSLWLHPAGADTGYVTAADGGDWLADVEAETEVLDPGCDFPPQPTGIVSGPNNPDPGPTGTILDGLISSVDGDRLDYAICVLEDIRNLLERNTSAAPVPHSTDDAADGPRGPLPKPDTRAGHPNPK